MPDWTVGGLALSGLMVGAGTVCAAYTLSLLPRRAVTAAPSSFCWTAHLYRRGTWLRAAGATGAGTVIGLVTGWPIGAVLAAAAGWWMPALLDPDTANRGAADLAEALASWTEQLRDMITGAAGLRQAVTATVPVAPEPVRVQVADLDARLRAGKPVDQAAAVFAEQVDSDLADLIAITLTMGASRQSGDVAGALSRLAEAARDRATTVARVSASRARVRSSVRIIAAATVLMLVGMAAFNPAFLKPLDTLSGQLVLGVVGALWAVSLFWLARLASPSKQPRPFPPVPSEAGTAVGGVR